MPTEPTKLTFPGYLQIAARIQECGILWLPKDVWFTHADHHLLGIWGMMRTAVDRPMRYFRRTLAMGAYLLQSLVYNPSKVSTTVTSTLKNMEAQTQISKYFTCLA